LTASQFDLAVAVIATKNYLRYAWELASSFSQMFEKPHTVKLCIFTDSPQSFETSDLRTAVELVKIPSYGWPEATLFRYQIISDHSEIFSSSFAMYVDADAVVSTKLRISDLAGPLNQSTTTCPGMCLVQHPGYASRSWIVSRLLKLAIGPWENRPDSLAYVPFQERKTYFCGGVYWGYTKSFLEMCTLLADWTASDLSQGITARFHDESYLNKWSTLNSHAVAGPEWAHAAQLRHLRNVAPKISVLVKPLDFVRQPT